jgi:calcineurin-like phosphoesterase family protein
MIFFTADQHFGHQNIIRTCSRPFASAEEMDEALTRNWNAAVGPGDEVYILGDFTMKPAPEAHRRLSALNGRKYLVVGNHDRFLKQFGPYAADLEWVKDYYVLMHGGRAFVLFHYPIAEWYGYFRGSIHLFGHIHNSPASAARVDASGLAFNVGVDCRGFRPVSIEEILALAERKSSPGN